MRPSLAAPFLSLSVLLLSTPVAYGFPVIGGGDQGQNNYALRELELLEERQAAAAEAAYRRAAVAAAAPAAGMLPPQPVVPIGQAVPHIEVAVPAVPAVAAVGLSPPPAPGVAVPAVAVPPAVGVVPNAPAVGVPPAGAAAANPPTQNVLTTITDSLAQAAGQDQLTLTIERKDAEAALVQVANVKRGLESLEELLKSAASLTRLSTFKAADPPEPPTLAPPPKPLSDDPALKDPHRLHAASPDSPDLPDIMHNEHAHLADLYYGTYPANELFYNKDVNNDLREPVPLVPVNVEKFRDYSAHPRLTAEEFFGRNRRKGAH